MTNLPEIPKIFAMTSPINSLTTSDMTPQPPATIVKEGWLLKRGIKIYNIQTKMISSSKYELYFYCFNLNVCCFVKNKYRPMMY